MIFTKKKENVSVPQNKKSVNEVIEEIHNTFYTEVDRLTDVQLQSLDTDKQYLIDKCERLKALGITASREVVEAEKEIKRLAEIRSENEKKLEAAEAARYFSQKYPAYRFITEESVKSICERYGLVYGVISKYTGEVPDENLKHIEDFKIHEEDMVYEKEDVYFGSRFSNTEIISHHQYIRGREEEEQSRAVYSNLYTYFRKQPLEIVAPLKDFNTIRSSVSNHKLVPIPDPIVLMPILYKGVKHYLIVTAWGKEAEDASVINEMDN